MREDLPCIMLPSIKRQAVPPTCVGMFQQGGGNDYDGISRPRFGGNVPLTFRKLRNRARLRSL